MSRYFISQPMRDLSREEILTERQSIVGIISKYDPDAQIFDLHSPEVLGGKTPLECLGISIQQLGKADLAIFVKGWWHARGCFLEHACCGEYGVPHVDLVFSGDSEYAEMLIRHAICDLKSTHAPNAGVETESE